MRTHFYAIYRHGSNRANQSMCEAAIVCLVEARSRKEAVIEARRRRDEEAAFTTYNNQFLAAVPRSRVSDSDWNAACEAEALDTLAN